jgi:phosphate-selective porin OprO and OprP
MILKYRGLLLASVYALASAMPTGAYAQEATTAATDPQAEAAMLQAQMEALQNQLDSLKERMKKKEDGMAWKGAPQFLDKDKGWEFKLRGRFQLDVGYLSSPNELTDTVANNGGRYGLRSGFRRIRIGAEGKLPGDFGYSAEFDFADSTISFGDVVLTYQAKDSPLKIIIGNHETWQSLEQVTSSRFVSFMERAQMNEAWGVGRRLGLSAQYRKNDILISGGVFNEAIPAGTDNIGANDGWLLGTRWNYNPKMGNSQLHFGANFQYRDFRQAGLSNTYQARPFSARPTNLRFVSTGNLAVKNDMTFGAEVGGVFGPLHVVGEAQMNRPNVLKPTDVNGLDTATTGTRLPGNPDFWSAYAELGYFFTGEARGYNPATARWDRVKVNNGFDKGGWGAWQLVARFDYLDLSDTVGAAQPRVAGAAASGNLYTSTAAALAADTNCVSNVAGAQCYVNGGKQKGYLVGLNWYPTDYVRFMLDFSYIDVSGVSIVNTAQTPANTLTGAYGNTLANPIGTSQSTGGLDTTLVSFRTAFDF